MKRLAVSLAAILCFGSPHLFASALGYAGAPNLIHLPAGTLIQFNSDYPLLSSSKTTRLWIQENNTRDACDFHHMETAAPLVIGAGSTLRVIKTQYIGKRKAATFIKLAGIKGIEGMVCPNWAFIETLYTALRWSGATLILPAPRPLPRER